MENLKKQLESPPKNFEDVLSSENLPIEKVPVKDMVVVFADILGTTDLMMEVKNGDNQKTEEIYEKLKTISRIFRDAWTSVFKENNKEIIPMEISDSFVLAVPIERKKELIKFVAKFQYQILEECKELMRGGIAKGKIIDWNNMNNDENDMTNIPKIIGPAFVSAHKLEKENAIYPRIVLDSDFCLEDIEDFVKRDKDGFNFVDFKQKNKGIEKIKENIQKKLDEGYKDDNKIKQKYQWLLSYLGEQNE